LNPNAPFVWESPVTQYAIEAVPVNTVESFVKIKLHNDGWGVPSIAAVKEIGSLGKAVSNASSQHESRLVRANETRNERL